MNTSEHKQNTKSKGNADTKSLAQLKEGPNWELLMFLHYCF